MRRLFFLFSFATIMASCASPEGKEINSEEAIDAAGGMTEMVSSAQFVVDPTASVINWEGAKPTGTHVGTVPVADGQIMVAQDNVVGGKFTIDLRKIENTDLPEAKKGDLVGHLMSEDFFHVEKYPMAEFSIVKVQALENGEDGTTHEITGNLTMRGQQRAITIPATVSLDGGQFKATTPKFTIDRTEWGVNYGSNSALGVVKDKAISDELGLQIMLVANK